MSKTFLEALTSVGKNLQSGVDQLKQTKVDFLDDLTKLSTLTGVYNLKNELKYGYDIRVNSNVTLLGNNNAIIKFPDTAEPYHQIFTINGKSNVVIDGIIFDGNSENVGGTITACTNFIRITNSDHVTIRNCVFKNSHGQGIKPEGCSHLMIENCVFLGLDSGINVEKGNNTDVIIKHCVFDGTEYQYSEPITFRNGQRIVIDSCIFRHKEDTMAIYVGAYDDVTISNCIITHCATGIYIADSDNVAISNCDINNITYSAITLNGRNIITSGCAINTVGNGFSFVTAYDDSSSNTAYPDNENITIIGCNIIGSTNYSVYVNKGGSYFLTGNMMNKTTTWGNIRIASGIVDMLVTGNLFKGTGYIASATANIGTGSKVIIRNNKGSETASNFNSDTTIQAMLDIEGNF